ncbi:hypothetical protein BKA80DRAFT_52146 [Phyllosticta citrichinensis]
MPSSKGKPTDPELREKVKKGTSRRIVTRVATRTNNLQKFRTRRTKMAAAKDSGPHGR